MRDIFANIKGKQKPKPTKLNPAAQRLDALQVGRPKRDPVLREIERIVGLPLIHSLTPEETEEFCRANQLVSSYNSGWRLFQQQAGAVLSYDLYEGGFFPVGVGAGKTLISLMIAERAYQNGIERSLLLVPPQVYLQLVNRGLPHARRHVPLSVPFMELGNTSRKKRLGYARSGRPGCYILPYSCLSTTDSSELLELMEPGLIIADEAHNLKNISKSARAKRLFGRHGYITKNEPQMVAMSGTITAKSVSDYWHIIKACLQENCPLPLSSHIVRQWGQVIDADTGGWTGPEDYHPAYDGFKTEPVMPLVRWAQANFEDDDFPETIRGFRRAYQFRLNTAPGVVKSAEHDIGTSLLMHNEPTIADQETEGWAKLTELIDGVEQDFKAPNGDEIDHAIHQYGWLYQLTAGFYNDLYWPTEEELAKERGISILDAADLLDKAQWHHKLKQLYNSALRKWLTRRSRPGMDTPFLVGGDMAIHKAKNVGSELYDAWMLAREADFEDRPERRSRPVRVCAYKVDQAVAWAKKLPEGTGAVLWIHHQEIGLWLMEALKAAGIDAIHCPAGANEEISSVGDPEMGGEGDRIVVASIGAHHVGKDLYAFQHQFVVQWPRSAVIAEQMIGRTHRTGQQADELVVVTNNTTDVDDLNFAACLNDACYIHDSIGSRQKLMIASYETPPIVVSPAALKRAGLDPKRLTGEQLQLLQDTFGELQE